MLVATDQCQRTESQLVRNNTVLILSGRVGEGGIRSDRNGMLVPVINRDVHRWGSVETSGRNRPNARTFTPHP